VVSNSGLLTGINRPGLLKAIVSIITIVLICEGSRLIIYQSRRWLRVGLRMAIVIHPGLLFVSLVLGLAVLFRQFVATGSLDSSVMMDSNIIVIISLIAPGSNKN